MFVIAYDLSVAEAHARHPKGSKQAYLDIKATLNRFGFERVQGSVYVAREEDLARLFQAIDALKALPWFGPSVKSIRAFRMEQGSDFTGVVQGATPGN
jgi:virulence-associated protein VapD